MEEVEGQRRLARPSASAEKRNFRPFSRHEHLYRAQFMLRKIPSSTISSWNATYRQPTGKNRGSAGRMLLVRFWSPTADHEGEVRLHRTMIYWFHIQESKAQADPNVSTDTTNLSRSDSSDFVLRFDAPFLLSVLDPAKSLLVEGVFLTSF